jgi:murein DD-endopeptidase MepM/ murein hydrolase activator NlpD
VRTAARALSRTVAPFVVVITLLMLGNGCHLMGGRPQHPEPPLGHWYVVESGETLADIARRAGVPEEDLLEVNGFHSAADAYPGKMIFVLFGPGSHPDAGPPPEAMPVAAEPQSISPSAEPQRKGPKTRFRWPVDSPKVTSLFGSRWGRPHEGIDLQAAIGTPVYAADEGEIVYAGNTVRGYGNMVVIKHPDQLLTVYAHNSVLQVKVGDHVAAGQRIALSGQSGHATGPHVHFEVRRAQVPRDPLQFLPGRNSKP